jgi:hypothetical protein
MKTQATVEDNTLSDDSHTYNVVLQGKSPTTGIGTCRLRIICVDKITANTIVAFLHELIDSFNIVGIV